MFSELQEQLDELDKKIALGKALERLQQNPDFKAVMYESFLTDWQEILVSRLNKRETFTVPGIREEIVTQLTGLVFVKNHFNTILEEGKLAILARQEVLLNQDQLEE